MDKDLRYLLHLYGEAPPPENPSDTGSKDARALAEMKAVLDQRLHFSPPESVIQEVLAAAGPSTQPSVPPGKRRERADRPAVARRFAGRIVGAGSGLLMVLLAALVLLWSFDDGAELVASQPEAAIADTTVPEAPASEGALDVEPVRSAVAARAESDTRQVQQAARERQAFRPSIQTVSATTSAAPIDQALPGLAWDDSDDLQDVHRMINVVQSRGQDIEWDEPAVPLELLGQPASSPRSGVRQVGYPAPRERP